MTVWTTLENNESYAVAIYNYPGGSTSSGVPLLPLEVGELVRVERRTDKWCWGRPVRNCGDPGAFPTSYVYFKDVVVGNSPEDECKITTSGEGVAHDIAVTLREWLTLWKELYLTRQNKNFDFISMSMRALLELRGQVNSKALPQDQLRKFARTARFTIDKGNRLLGRELAVRDSQGDLIDPTSLSLYELNTLHEETNSRLDKNMDAFPRQGQSPRESAHCYSVCVRVMNVVCRGAQPAELLLALYDQRGNKLTEHLLMHWPPPKAHQLSTTQVLFTELSSEALGIGQPATEVKRIFLVCHIIKLGSMDIGNNNTYSGDLRRTSAIGGGSASSVCSVSELPPGAVRRPLGVCAVDVTPYIGPHAHTHTHTHPHVPFYPYEKEYLDTLLSKILSTREPKDTKDKQGLYVQVQLLHGDANQILRERPADVVGGCVKARAVGLPDVLAPGDLRNDLHVTLLQGHYTRSGKAVERNLQLTVTVRDSKGRKIPGCISRGAGFPLTDSYDSVVYYHDDRPRWVETFRVALDIETFKLAHLLVVVRHRSSNEAKDRNERPFALSYIKLMQPNGTTLSDAVHELAVYKIDYKRAVTTDPETEAAATCLGVSERKRGRDENGGDNTNVITRGPLTLLPKDQLTIQTTLASTKLTQKEEIVGVLKWSSRLSEGTLKESVSRLLLVPCEELVKFLSDILDALFAILTQVEEDALVGPNEYEFDETSYAVLVLDCLLLFISNIHGGDRKYQQFKAVINLYIEYGFSDAAAYERLLKVIRWTVLSAVRNGFSESARLSKTLKFMEHLIRLVVRSRQLRADLSPNDHKAEQDFKLYVGAYFSSLRSLIQCDKPDALACKAFAVRHLPPVAECLQQLLPPEWVANEVMLVLQALPISSIPEKRLNALREIAKGPLLEHPVARAALLPHIADTISDILHSNIEAEALGSSRSAFKAAKLLGAETADFHLTHPSNQFLVETCVEVAGCVVSQVRHEQASSNRINLCISLLPTMLKMCVWTADMREKMKEDEDHPLSRRCVCVLLDLVRDMTPEQWNSVNVKLRKILSGPTLASDAICLFRHILRTPVFRSSWADMLHTQLSVMLHVLSLLSETLRARLQIAEETTYDNELMESTLNIWKDWFAACSELCCARPLQLESLSRSRRNRVLRYFTDLRPPTATLLVSMWAALDRYKRSFIPWIVVPVLDASFVNNDHTRDQLIPLFNDMCETEFTTKRGDEEALENMEETPESAERLIQESASALLDRVDELAESGLGDAEWRAKFVTSCSSPSIPPELRGAMSSISRAVSRQLDTLLEYRTAGAHKALLITELLAFYKQIQRLHLYVRYVHKLAEIHKSVGLWAEAGLTLELHAELLSWSDEPVPPGLSAATYTDHYFENTSQRYHKEALYMAAAKLLEQGQHWEVAVQLVSELVRVYERDARGYGALSRLHQRLATLYQEMEVKHRCTPAYFRVRYHGTTFPKQLTTAHGFVYKGNDYEKLSGFTERVLEEWPDATLLNKLGDPDDDIINSDKQYIQVNAVEPVLCEERVKSVGERGEAVPPKMLDYYTHNHTHTFLYDRPEIRHEESLDEKDRRNDFAKMWLERTELKITNKLPGILSWFPISSVRTWWVCPIEAAIETVKTSNKTLKQIADGAKSQTIPLQPLSSRLMGILDAAVQGGVQKYEEAFLTDRYLAHHPDHTVLRQQLIDAIVDQLPVLEYALHIHWSLIQNDPDNSSISLTHSHLVKCLEEMKMHISKQYGKQPCPLQNDAEVLLRREMNVSRHANRLSDTSNAGDIHHITSPSKSRFPKLQIRSTNGYSTLPTKRKAKAGKRKSDTRSTSSASQWYAPAENGFIGAATSVVMSATSILTAHPLAPSTPLRELRQELVTERPLRSEAEKEKRLSARTSTLFTASSNTSSNRDSIGTTDSNQDEEERPPLPVKPVKSHKSQQDNQTENNDSTDGLVQRHSYDVVRCPRGSFLHSSLSPRPPASLPATPLSPLTDTLPSPHTPPTPPPKNRTKRN